MTKTMEEIMAKFTPEEQAEIQAEADKLIAEEMKRQEKNEGNVRISHINYKKFEIKNDCLMILPDNFFNNNQDNFDNYFYSSETISFYKYAQQKNIKIDYFAKPDLLLERYSYEWFAPSLLLTSEIISHNPEIVSIVCGLISNYIYDLFKSEKKPNIRLNVIYKETKNHKLTKINYQGTVDGISELEKVLLEMVKKS
jgi:hypothetical protein